MTHERWQSVLFWTVIAVLLAVAAAMGLGIKWLMDRGAPVWRM